jgi:hypothetical protein
VKRDFCLYTTGFPPFNIGFIIAAIGYNYLGFAGLNQQIQIDFGRIAQ